ncbi:MAG: hypothetical protein MJZ12_04970 [Prevotella sp.]|nr:hypothetical protein [Prevotella sp.]
MKRFQNEIAESKFSLPISSIYGILVWIAAGLIGSNLWLPFSLVALSVYLMAELNNRNTLLRVRSRMVSCSFVFLSAMNLLSISNWRVALVMFCFVSFIFLIFHTCQDDMALGAAFSAFIFIGIASLAWVNILFFVPVLLFLMFRPLYGMSLRVLSASVLGLIIPYWISSLYIIYMEGYGMAETHIMTLTDFSWLFKYEGVTLGMTVNFAFLVVSGLLGAIHFMHNSYKDKIRVRLLFTILIIASTLLIVFISVAPPLGEYLIPILTVTTSPLIAHFFTFTNSRASNYTFIVWIVLAIAITVFSLCLTSSYNMVLSECL